MAWLPRNRTLQPRVPVKGNDDDPPPVSFDEVVVGKKKSKEVPYSELQEGDLILLRGRRIGSLAIGFWSRGASHVGVMVQLDGELWFVESVSWRDSEKDVQRFVNRQGKGRCYNNGVVGAALPSLVKSYTRSGVFRPTPSLTTSELVVMREEFERLHGLSYEHSWLRLLNSIPSLPASKPAKKFYCSQLVAHLFRKIERLQVGFSRKRYDTGDYLPSHVIKAIQTNYKGHLTNTEPLRKLVPNE